MQSSSTLDTDVVVPRRSQSAWCKAWQSRTVRLSALVLILMVLMAVAAPWLYTIDPAAIDPASANLAPGTHAEFTTLDGSSFQRFFLFGTDSLGRDVWSRIAYGARTSLVVGAIVAALSLLLGFAVGCVATMFKYLDSVMMRMMDGLMAIPGVLLAISLVAVWRPGLYTVILAITLSEIPPVARLVRSVMLSVREEPYVEAAVALDTRPWKIVLRHLLPNAIGPLVVQGTFVCAAAMLTEAIMSFLGVGLPPDIPTWGNLMSEGRQHFTQFPHVVLLPGAFLAVTVLAVNMLGDGLRDVLDPKFSKKGDHR
jgi:peptide/nickel transport system permease protein